MRKPILATILLAALPLSGAGVPRQKFLTRKMAISIGASVAMMTADMITTERALQIPGIHEENPLARGTARMISLKIAGVGAGVGISYAFHRLGCERTALAVPIIFGSPSFAAAIHNATLKK